MYSGRSGKYTTNLAHVFCSISDFLGHSCAPPSAETEPIPITENHLNQPIPPNTKKKKVKETPI